MLEIMKLNLSSDQLLFYFNSPSSNKPCSTVPSSWIISPYPFSK